MHQTIFPNLGDPVSVDAINEDRIDEMTLGELAYARALFGQKFSERLAQPGSINEIATFTSARGADWSGHDVGHSQASQDAQYADKASGSGPVAPDNYVDTLQAIMSLMTTEDRANDAALANLVRKLEVACRAQTDYLGVPENHKGFRDVKEILRNSMQMSGYRANRIIARAKYVTYGTATDQTVAGAAPKLAKVASSFSAGKIPSENLDRIIQLDEDLAKYAAIVNQTPEYKDLVLQAFEPTLKEAAETATPEEITQAKQRWFERIAYHIDADGPSPSQALKKQPDNALHLRSHDDGTATVSMHMDPVWAAVCQEFLNTNLNYKGNKPLLPENIENLYKAMADAKAAQQQDPAAQDRQTNVTSEANEESEEKPDDGTFVAEDAEGNTYTTQQADWIDVLTRAQRAGAVVLGALWAVMSMDPDEAAAKRAHGSPAKLVIVQDIQTAYVTLGLPALPEAVRRPTGPDGITPATAKLSGPESLADTIYDGTYTRHANKTSWTPYQSEAVNIGPVHPKNAKQIGCDAELVGQIWNGQDIVLNEYRSKRLFTTAQRKAILARDKGCQAPGCTVQATYCQCHHCQEWSKNGQTNVDNGITLCARHHADIHNGKWIIRKVDGVTYFQPARWVDPYQPLLRNLYWNI